MPWFPVDDAFHSHPKARKAGDEAIGLWARAGAYCMAYLTDGFVADWWVKGQPKGLVKARRLIEAELWRRGEKDGESGYYFHDWKAECTKGNILADRRANAARQEVARNPQLRAAIRARDGDACRYCGTPVEWHNRRGPTGGTYDHVIPNGGTTIANLVVCCRGCNSRKGRRTPEQAGMALRPVPNGDGPGGGVSSDLVPDLTPSKSESRSVINPHHTTPHHSSSLVNSGGGVTQATRERPPRPECSEHPENFDGPCRKCKRRREWDEQHAAQAKADELEQRRTIKAHAAQIRRSCRQCDGDGWLLAADGTPVEPAIKCTHQGVSHA